MILNLCRDALDILSPHIKVGTVIILDELQNYQHYRQHEIKALWEYLVKSGTHLLPIGMYGPLTGKEYAMELDIQGAAAWEAYVFIISWKFALTALPCLQCLQHY